MVERDDWRVEIVQDRVTIYHDNQVSFIQLIIKFTKRGQST